MTRVLCLKDELSAEESRSNKLRFWGKRMARNEVDNLIIAGIPQMELKAATALAGANGLKDDPQEEGSTVDGQGQEPRAEQI